jgi:4-hydroxy-tetrahydrodipicolinate synthase
MSLFNGLCGFPITPADPQGRVDTEALARLVTRLADSGVASVGLLGSTGTYVYLSREERRRAIEAAAEALGGKAPLMAGVGALRTDAALDLARDARKAGADGVLLAPVSYLPLTEEEVFAHFQAVAAETETPLCVYNNPTTTGFTFTPELLGRLAAIPNVVAVKNPAPRARTGPAWSWRTCAPPCRTPSRSASAATGTPRRA